MGVKRFAPIVVLACALGAFSPSAANASESDVAAFDILFGGTTAKYFGQRKWQPTLWLDGSAGVAGPLHLGAYFQWLGRSWPLQDPGFGGGGMIALRPNVKNLLYHPEREIEVRWPDGRESTHRPERPRGEITIRQP